jgi:hypothetical protein
VTKKLIECPHVEIVRYFELANAIVPFMIRRMFRTRWRGVFVRVSGAFFLPVLIGCQAPAAPSAPTEMVLQVRDYDAFVDSTLSLLRRCDFNPDVVDRANGLIVTGRTTGAQWFEFWRHDTPAGYELLESSLQTIGRTVTVTIKPESPDTATRPASEEPSTTAAVPTTTEAADSGELPEGTESDEKHPGPYRVVVLVDKSRYSSPERQITTASGALTIFSEKIPTAEGLRVSRAAGVRWIPIGRDGQEEAYLLAQIAAAGREIAAAE